MQAQLGKQARLGHSSSNRPAISGPAPRRALSHFAPAKANASNEPSASSSLSSVDIDPDALLRASPSSAARSLAGPAEWFDTAPRVRVRPADARQMEVLVELAVLNERLSGSLQPWEARRKLEYLRTKRKNWERIFAYITSQELDATLAVIEEANRKVEESFNAEARDRTGVGALRNQLQALQTDISAAQARLTATQAAVEAELARVTELRREAENLERLRSGTLASTSSSTAAVAPIASDSASATLAPPVQREATRPRTVPQPRPEQQQQQQQQAPKPQRKAVASTAAPNRRRALHSSIKLEEPLKNFWYACEFSSRLPKDTLVPIELFGEPWVLFRDAQGKASCIRDECAHRACPLSIGKIEQGEVVCPYHGWTYDGSGSCNKMPSTRHCKGVSVKALTCVEKDGFIWVWPGKMPEGGEEALPEIPNTLPPEGYEIHAEICVDVPVEHGLLVENLLDLAHAPFTHQTTFARGWPVPDVVKFHTEKALWGHWDPYPIDMGFLPPCMTVSLIGLDKPGQVARGARALACKNHLHQLHVCLPSKPGHTRLLYRMSLDFIPWLRHVPFIDKVWKNVAGQVLGEDLVLVIGQQDRMQRGGNTWAFPVSYDKIAVRYRRWRNEVEAAGSARRAGDDAAAAAAFERAAALAASASLVSAGQLFASDQEDEVIAEVHAERARAKTGEL